MSRSPKFKHGNGGDTVLLCETCDTPIKKKGIGWLTVDPIAATIRGVDWERGIKRPEVQWHIYHGSDKCLPKANGSAGWASRPEFRIFACDIETIELLLLKTLELADREWICDTNWYAICKRIIADSKHYADKQKSHANAISKTRKARGLVGIGQKVS